MEVPKSPDEKKSEEDEQTLAELKWARSPLASKLISDCQSQLVYKPVY